MRIPPALSATLLLAVLPCCVQIQNDCVIEEVRFAGHERPELEAVLARVVAYMEGLPRQAEMDADKLAERSGLREDYPCGYIPLETLEEAEEAYLDMEPHERLRLAAEVMNALLSSPAQLMGESMACKPQRVHSYQKLDVSAWRPMAGEFFATQATEREEFIRTALFKRMVARIILEEVACHEELGLDMRCAAVECLRHICLDGLLEADGGWESRYIVDALPLYKRSGSELESVLFGGPAWESQLP